MIAHKTFVWKPNIVHSNELRLFRGECIPLIHTFKVASVIALVGTVESSESVWVEHRIHHLPDARYATDVDKKSLSKS